MGAKGPTAQVSVRPAKFTTCIRPSHELNFYYSSASSFAICNTRVSFCALCSSQKILHTFVMRSLLCLAALLLLAATCAHAEDISLKKVWVVDSTSYPKAALFRGNAPLQNKRFAYDTLMSYMRTKATNASVPGYPADNSKIYLVDITFENLFDHGYEDEAHFWQNASNAAKGRYEAWLLMGAPLWGEFDSAAEQRKDIASGKIWKVDQIPSRLLKMRAMLAAGPPPGYDFLAVYVHCAGGCDRTGEFVASYRMQYFHTAQLAPIYAQNVQECGRAPNYFSTGATGWYCTTWNLFNNTGGQPAMTDCWNVAKCDLFKGCTSKVGG